MDIVVLAADLQVAVEHDGRDAAARQVVGRSEACRSSPDDDDRRFDGRGHGR